MTLSQLRRSTAVAAIVLAVGGLALVTQAHADTTRTPGAAATGTTPVALRIFDGASARRPSSIQPAAGTRIVGITWTSWSPTAASGSGTALHSFDPTGEDPPATSSTTTTVRLSAPKTLNGTRVFTELRFTGGARADYTVVRDPAGTALLTYAESWTGTRIVPQRVPVISRAMTGLAYDVVRPRSLTTTTQFAHTQNHRLQVSQIVW